MSSPGRVELGSDSILILHMHSTLLLDVRELAEQRRIGDFLRAAATPSNGTGRLMLAMIADGCRYFAVIGETVPAIDERHHRVLLGCLMKTITATLVAFVTEENQDSWDEEDVEHALSLQHAHRGLGLSAVQLRQLLNHTHGLDDSLIPSVPKLANGAVDAHALCAALLSTPPLAQAGKLYSYGSAGAWLSGAVLERRTHRTYRELLFERLIGPLRLTSVLEEEADRVCPAGRGRFTLSLDDALTFLEVHLRATAQSPATGAGAALTRLRANPVAVPGWGLAERAVCQGWKYYGSGWYGHDARMPGYSSVVRIHPATDVGIVFAGAGKHPYSTFSRLFARALPEFTALRLPEVLSKDVLQQTDFSPFEGTYCTGALEIKVGLSAAHTLQYQVVSRVADRFGTDGLQPLVAAAQNVFFPKKKPDPRLPFLQFLLPDGDGRHEYLWNGRCLWRRSR
jgi:CubicO group peptidase (beta-lactamase class C family)